MSRSLPFRLLIVDDYEPITKSLLMVFEPNKWYMKTANNAIECQTVLQKETFDLVLLDLDLNGTDGMQVLKKIKTNYLETDVIILSGNADPTKVKEALSSGASDYIEKGGKLEMSVLQAKVNAIYQKKLNERGFGNNHGKRGNRSAKNSPISNQTHQKEVIMIGNSPELEKVKKKIKTLAPTNISILIAGENGTGKELVAQSIHENSKRANGPFIAFNCGGLESGVLISELFGHKKASFTGADGEKIGLLEAANGGTLFLDEIGEISLEMQIMLLRAFETRRVKKLGEINEVETDFRLITASNKNLKEEIKNKAIREDFYHRICQQKITVPALNDRKSDIPELVAFFSDQIAKKEGFEPKTFMSDAVEYLQVQDWSGNIRELRNVVFASICTTQSSVIFKSDIEFCMEDL